jgi:hypothetical protein
MVEQVFHLQLQVHRLVVAAVEAAEQELLTAQILQAQQQQAAEQVAQMQ